jgi:uncharacterized membrane protein
MKNIANKVIFYFFQGVLFTAPVAVTLYVLYIVFHKIDSVFELPIPGLGFLIILIGITVLGFISNTFLISPVLSFFDKVLQSLPLVKIIYTSLKDLIEAFVGDKKKFEQPVLVYINKESNLQKMGFITRADMEHIGIKDKIAVYLPHSYNFSGDLYVVSSSNITILNIPPGEAMKFIVSGGVSGFDNDKHETT